MKDTQQRAAAKAFAEQWQGKGYEKGDSQPFWLSLLRDVYGVEHPEQFIRFEEQAHQMKLYTLKPVSGDYGTSRKDLQI